MSFSIQPKYSININGAIFNENLFTAKIEIDMNCSIEADMFKVIIYNVDQFTQSRIVEGATITITLGFKAGFNSKIITGIITKVNRGYEDQDLATEIIGIDLSISNLKTTPINLSIANPTDIIEVIRNIASEAGVKLSVDSVLSGIILNSYSVNNKKAFYVIKDLAKILKYNVTTKLSQLYVTRSIISTLTIGTITDFDGFTFYKISGINQDDETDVLGYKFEGNGIPLMTPMKTVTLAIIEQNIFGLFVIESVKHIYDEKGYRCEGTLIEIKQESETINIISSDIKSLSAILANKINDFIFNKPTADTGIVKSLISDTRKLTAKIGINEEDTQSIVNKSTDAPIGNEEVFVNEKPIMSPFAGDGYGQIIPTYQNNRCVLLFNRYDNQDINIIGYLWEKDWTIPEHDEGEYLIHHVNHSKFSMKEDGHGIMQFKGLKIEINTSLTEAKTVPTSNGYLIIDIGGIEMIKYNGSDLILENGSKITINSSGVDVT
jgi:hypothetical protein